MSARLIPTREHLAWPFFGPEQRAFAADLDAFVTSGALDGLDHHDTDNTCRTLVQRMGAAGLLRACVPEGYGGVADPLDSRRICLARETLAYQDGLADFAFAMQGLGTGAISLAGSEALKQRVLPRVAAGETIAAFALSEAEAGSDV